MSPQPRFCHPEFGCDCGPRVRELEEAVTDGDLAVSAVHDLVHAHVKDTEVRRALDAAIWAVHGVLRPAVPDALLGRVSPGDGVGGGLRFPEASVASESLAALRPEIRQEHDRRQ